jgi:hypothetical protein
LLFLAASLFVVVFLGLQRGQQALVVVLDSLVKRSRVDQVMVER